MSDQNIVDEIVASIREVKRDGEVEIGADTNLSELGIDSLDFVELLFSLEEKFGIDLPFNANDGAAFPFTTVGNAAQAIAQRIQDQAKAA